MNRTLLCLAAFAAAAPAHSAAVSEEHITVTATRTPLAVEDALAPVIVITGEELRRTATFDIAEALRLHAGLEIGRTGGPGQSASLFIRGTNSNHALVLIDGVRINPGTLGGAALHNLRPQDIERIEVVKGPRSTLYGTQAVGGVVNVITRRAQEPLRFDAEVGAGRYGTRSMGAGIAGRGDAWYAGLRMDHLETDGFPPRRESDVARGHDNTTVGAHLGHDAGGHTVELRHREARGNTEYLDFLLTPADQDFVNATTALEYTMPLAGQSRAMLRVARTADEIRQRQSADHAITRRTTADLQVDVPVATSHEFNVGAQAARENTRAEVFGAVFDERPDSREAFAQYQFHGTRHQALLALRHTDHDAFDDHWTWNAEAGRDLGDAWRFTAGAGTAFRAPDSTERFGFGGNPDLLPETSRNLEIGLRGRLGEHRRLDWQLYENRITDLVTFDMSTFTLANIDRARIRGTELSHVYARGRWYWRKSLVLQRPTDLATGEPLPRRARRSAQTALVFNATDGLSFGLDMLATGPRRDSAFSDDMIGGYALVNASAQWSPAPSWSLDVRVENLLDKDYETALGFPQAGRSLFMRARWRH